MTYLQAIKAARERYAEAMEAAAWDVLAIVEEHGRPLQTVCKDVAGEGWNALRNRAQKLAKTAGRTAEERARAARRESEKAALRHAKQVLRDPEMRARLLSAPETASAVEHELAEQARRHGKREEPLEAPVDWRELFTDLVKVKRRVGGIVQRLSGGLRVPASERGDFAEMVNEIRAGLDLVESGIQSGRSIADEARDYLEEAST